MNSPSDGQPPELEPSAAPPPEEQPEAPESAETLTSLPPEVQQLLLQQWWVRTLRRRGRAVPALLALLLAVGILQAQADNWWGAHTATRLLLAAACVPELVLRGEWWRLGTWWLVHADVWHMMVNALMVLVIGRPVEAAFGGARLWLIWLGSALAAAVALVVAPESTWTVGASGATFGLLGALVGLGLKLMPKLGPRMRWTMVGVPALALALLLSLSGERVDQLAHAAGAVGGIAMGLLLRPQFLPMPRALRWRLTPLWMRLTALLATLGMVAAVAAAVSALPHPLRWPAFKADEFSFDHLTVRYPAGLRRGTLQQQGLRCVGDLTDGAWALRTQRMPCWPLPLSGLLVLGSREKLFSMDAADQAAFDRANKAGHFEWRQEGVLVYPMGDQLVWVIFAEEPLLPTYAKALAAILPPAGSAKVEGIALPAQPSAAAAPLAAAASAIVAPAIGTVGPR